MTGLLKRPSPAALSYWPLVAVVADRLNCGHRVYNGEDFGADRDVLVVRVGPSVPMRLLTVESSADGLIHLTLWQANGRIKAVEQSCCTSDLVDVVLTEWAVKYGLGA